MTMTMRKQSRTSTRGFTLTEIAIVLGIIGLILGAIWVAASAVYNNLRVSKTTTELLQITQAVRSMYSTATTADAGANMTAFGTAAQPAGAARTYIQSGVFPNDALDTGQPNTATRAIDPWNGNIVVTAAAAAVAGDNLAINVTFDSVPQSACISLLTGNTGQGRDSALLFAGAGATGAIPANSLLGGTAPPITAATAQGQCPAAGAAVGFTFRLK